MFANSIVVTIRSNLVLQPLIGRGRKRHNIFFFLFFFDKQTDFIKNAQAQPNYIGFMQEKYLTRKGKKSKKIVKARNIKVIIGYEGKVF
jgi:hypothetical protein